MEKRSAASQLILGMKLLVCLTVVFAMSAAHAEYYMVYSSPPPLACPGCVGPNFFAPPPVVKKHYAKKKNPCAKKHYAKKTHYKKRSTYSISVYYVYQGAPGCSCVAPCDCCGQWTAVRQQIQTNDGVYRRARVVEPNYSYNPDMSTGDDNASTYPGMQIN